MPIEVRMVSYQLRFQAMPPTGGYLCRASRYLPGVGARLSICELQSAVVTERAHRYPHYVGLLPAPVHRSRNLRNGEALHRSEVREGAEGHRYRVLGLE